MTSPQVHEEPGFAVVSPLGREQVGEVHEHGSLSTLDGRTVGFIWDYLFKGDRLFDAVRRAVQQQADDVRFVGHEHFGNIHGSAPEERANVAAIADRIREAQVDAVVVAVGA